MSHQVITDFDVVFALHTGVTIMMPRQSAFDKNDEAEANEDSKGAEEEESESDDSDEEDEDEEDYDADLSGE